MSKQNITKLVDFFINGGDALADFLVAVTKGIKAKLRGDSKRIIRYGGSLCDGRDMVAGVMSLMRSFATGQWQAGPEAKLFEQEMADAIGVKHALFTSSGSAAGLLALSAYEFPEGSEVIIPAVTFPTIFNIIPQCNLVPVVVDCEVGTYNIKVSEIEKAITDKTVAIIAVHAVGNPADMPAIMKIAKKHRLKVIEDNCDGWGGEINGKKVGSFGDCSITSTHAAHIITSGGVGGLVLSNSKKFIDTARQYKDWGRQANTNKPHDIDTLPPDYNPRFVYTKVGYNLQPLELQAAIGRTQLKKADKIKALRKKNYEYLYKHLSKFRDLIMPKVVDGADPCWFAFPLSTTGDRGELVKHLEANGIETRSMFAGNITKHPLASKVTYRVSGDLDEADIILEKSFWIGVHPSFTDEDRRFIVKTFEDYYA